VDRPIARRWPVGLQAVRPPEVARTSRGAQACGLVSAAGFLPHAVARATILYGLYKTRDIPEKGLRVLALPGVRREGDSTHALWSRLAWPSALSQVAPPTESAPDLEEGPDPPQRRPWFDRQGIIQAHAGFVVALIALLSSYDHISLPAGISFQLQQQWGVWFMVASMALVLADAQLAKQSRHREADQRLQAANEAARD
jgi:hypothetical protein